jgi:hypothetical protein
VVGQCRVSFYINPFPAASNIQQCFTYSELLHQYGEMSQAIARLYSFNWLDFIVYGVMTVDLYTHLSEFYTA